MNSESSEILDQLGLKQTETFTLLGAANSAEDQDFYLRYRTGSGFKNARASAREIKSSFIALTRQMDSGDLLTCERCYETIVGGVTLLKRDFAYSEVVLGHSNVLLRRGCCGARVIHRHDGSFDVLKTVQKWLAEQKEAYVYKPTGDMEPNLINDVCGSIQPLTHQRRSGLVLEWMWTTAGFYYCDAHVLDRASFGDSLPLIFSRNVTTVSLNPGVRETPNRPTGGVHLDAFDCELSPPAQEGDTILCCNGAILSHFVIRASSKGVGIHWVLPSKLLSK